MLRCANCSYIIDEEMCSCPNCRTALDKKSVRTAQFGGVGGGPPKSWMPGSSPHARSSTGGSSSWQIDMGLDAIMGQSRQNVDEDHMGDVNIETRLAKFHHYLEDDMKPYLPFKERQKIKKNENIQRREKFEKDTAEAVFKNSPKYIKENFFPKLEHMLTLEEQLSEIHEDDGDRTSVSKDKVTIIDPITGTEKVASTKLAKIRHTTNTSFGPRDDSDEGGFASNQGPGSPDYSQFHYWPMGNSGDNDRMGGPLVAGFSQSEVEDLLSNQEIYPYLDESTLAYDYPQADEVTMDGERAYDKIDSVLKKDKDDTIKIDIDEPLEKQLSELNDEESPDALPGDPSETFNMDKIRGQEGLQTKYPYKYHHTYPMPGI